MPRAYGGPGGGAVSYERGTPVRSVLAGTVSGEAAGLRLLARSERTLNAAESKVNVLTRLK